MHSLIFVFDHLVAITIESHLLDANNLKSQLLAWVALNELRINSAGYYLTRHEIITVSNDL
jgi:hypothetical protein